MRVDSPLGIILVSKDDTAERVLFMYPFGPGLPVIGTCSVYLTEIVLRTMFRGGGGR